MYKDYIEKLKPKSNEQRRGLLICWMLENRFKRVQVEYQTMTNGEQMQQIISLMQRHETEVPASR